MMGEIKRNSTSRTARIQSLSQSVNKSRERLDLSLTSGFETDTDTSQLAEETSTSREI